MKMSPDTLSFMQRLLVKFNEKSSVYGYAMIFAGQFLAAKYQTDITKASGVVSAAVGALLWLLSDEQVRYWLTGQKPSVLPDEPTVPRPVQKSESS